MKQKRRKMGATYPTEPVENVMINTLQVLLFWKLSRIVFLLLGDKSPSTRRYFWPRFSRALPTILNIIFQKEKMMLRKVSL